MPPAGSILRLLAFAVTAGLAAAAAQPLLAAVAGSVPPTWAVSMSAPAIAVAIALFAADRLSDHAGVVPPWYSAWLLLPGAFLLAGAASMCLVGAFVPLPAARIACWEMLAGGGVLWTAALLWVRRPAR